MFLTQMMMSGAIATTGGSTRRIAQPTSSRRGFEAARGTSAPRTPAPFAARSGSIEGMLDTALLAAHGRIASARRAETSRQ